jgi:hypothetical protein
MSSFLVFSYRAVADYIVEQISPRFSNSSPPRLAASPTVLAGPAGTQPIRMEETYQLSHLF